MSDYFLDDASNATNDGASWATCYNTWAQVASAGILTAANRLIVGADAAITDPGAALTITGPTSDNPTTIISSTVGSGTTVAYSVGTAKQVNTQSGNYVVTFDGSFSLYGLWIAAGSTGDAIMFANDNNEFVQARNCKYTVGASGSVVLSGSNQGRSVHLDCTFDFTNDGTTNRTGYCVKGGTGAQVIVKNPAFINIGYRTGSLWYPDQAYSSSFSGADVSALQSSCEIVESSFCPGLNIVSNILTASSFTPITTSAPRAGGRLDVSNVGPADSPSYAVVKDYLGLLQSSAATGSGVYRTTGATVETIATAWIITTTAVCTEATPFYTPYLYGTIGTAGSKTFDVYTTNDTADLTDAEMWLEVEYLGTDDEAQWTLATDQRATITTTAAAQTDDTTSTWNGTGPSFTYKQKLSVTATVNETGQYRARVAVGKASIASSAYFYIDPKVTVS